MLILHTEGGGGGVGSAVSSTVNMGSSALGSAMGSIALDFSPPTVVLLGCGSSYLLGVFKYFFGCGVAGHQRTLQKFQNAPTDCEKQTPKPQAKPCPGSPSLLRQRLGPLPHPPSQSRHKWAPQGEEEDFWKFRGFRV